MLVAFGARKTTILLEMTTGKTPHPPPLHPLDPLPRHLTRAASQISQVQAQRQADLEARGRSQQTDGKALFGARESSA